MRYIVVLNEVYCCSQLVVLLFSMRLLLFSMRCIVVLNEVTVVLSEVYCCSQ